MDDKEKLELYKKALCILAGWVEEASIFYGPISRYHDKYENDITEKHLDCVEENMYIPLCEAKKDVAPIQQFQIDNVDKSI